MKFAEAFRIAVRALSSNKARSALTMLGVIIGVAAVILLVAIGTGVQREITGTIETLGSNLLFVFPYHMETGGGFGGGGRGPSGKTFTIEDAQAVARRVPGLEAAVPVTQGGGLLRYGNKSMRSALSGATEQGSVVFNATLGAGRNYNKSEVDAGARVAMIAFTVKETLFPYTDPIGKVMTINGQRFTIIGWYEKQGGSLSGDQDNAVYLPITTLQTLTGSDRVPVIVIKVRDANDIEVARAQVTRALEPKFADNLTVMSQDQTLGILSTVLGTLTYMLAGLASISLLVGGIGIMNIMLVSVTERTREIGIRKAVGARTYDIMSQFVIEAMLLSLLGGSFGIALGVTGALALNGIVPTAITAWAVALAFFFSAGVGIFFGVYPAWKASRLDPIEALRYE